MNVLVTGAIGYVGGRLVLRLIAAGHRVFASRANRVLMNAPGRAWLQFEVQPRDDGGSRLVQTAFFEPHRLPGLIYWWTLYPVHQLIFSGLAREVVRRAERTPPVSFQASNA